MAILSVSLLEIDRIKIKSGFEKKIFQYLKCSI